MSESKYIEIKLDGKNTEELVHIVALAVYHLSRMVDDPVLYNHSITFDGDTCLITWDRAPDVLHDDLKRIFRS